MLVIQGYTIVMIIISNHLEIRGFDGIRFLNNDSGFRGIGVIRFLNNVDKVSGHWSNKVLKQ